MHHSAHIMSSFLAMQACPKPDPRVLHLPQQALKVWKHSKVKLLSDFLKKHDEKHGVNCCLI